MLGQNTNSDDSTCIWACQTSISNLLLKEMKSVRPDLSSKRQ